MKGNLPDSSCVGRSFGLLRSRFLHGAVILALSSWMGCSPEPEQVDTAFDPIVPGEAIVTRPVILFLGNSLTAGYQLDPDDAFPALIQKKIEALGLPYRVMNAGVSGDTSTDGLNRLDWLLRQPVDVLVLALGANDALRGQPVEHIRANLGEIIDRTRGRYPGVRVLMAGMRMPDNYGREYTETFEAMYKDLAGDREVVLIPFLLEGVAGRPDMNLPDAIHPTEAGHQIIAGTVWSYLAPLLEVEAASSVSTRPNQR